MLITRLRLSALAVLGPAFRGIIENDRLDEGTVNRILREIMHSKTGCRCAPSRISRGLTGLDHGLTRPCLVFLLAADR